MTEIQLKNIVERLKSDEKKTKTDGDETMVKNGIIISKFSFEALGLGSDLMTSLRAKFTLGSCNGQVMIQCFQLKMDHRRF